MSKPTVSTDSVAQDQIRAFVERILRMKEEAKAINDDIREIYAEAKGNGFDKTVLGKLVNYVEKRTKDSAAVAEADAIFDLYLEAYDGTPSRTHAHEGTIPRESNQGKTDTAGRHSAQLDGVVSRTSGGVDTPATITEPADTAPAVVTADAGEATASASPATNSDAIPPVSDDDGSNPAIMGEADPSVSPDHSQIDAIAPVTASVEGEADTGSASPAISETSNVVPLKSYANDPPHPDCLKPSLCKGYSNITLCQPCIDAAAGFVQVPHEGSING